MSAPASQAADSLQAFLGECQDRVNGTLKNLLAEVDANQQLEEAMRYATLNGGKRIRPVLVYAAALAVEAPLDRADLPACAVELIHSYSLAHDDLPAMDDDDLRRGKPSLHRAYDEATAILAGDAMQCLAFEILANEVPGLTETSRLQMLAELASAAGARGMVAGQVEDFAAVGKDISLAQLEAMHSKKTGALISACVALGGLCNPRIEQAQREALQEYAAHVGLAFQVQDDVLDVIADTAVLGKPQGSDKLNNKPTYVTLLGLDGARSKALELAEQARSSLDNFSSAADQLRHLASYVVSRGH